MEGKSPWHTPHYLHVCERKMNESMIQDYLHIYLEVHTGLVEILVLDMNE